MEGADWPGMGAGWALDGTVYSIRALGGTLHNIAEKRALPRQSRANRTLSSGKPRTPHSKIAHYHSKIAHYHSKIAHYHRGNPEPLTARSPTITRKSHVNHSKITL